MQCGDWVCRIYPAITSMSLNAHVWWDAVLVQANQYHQQYMMSGPVQRQELVILEDATVSSRQFIQLAAKTAEILLAALDESFAQELVGQRMTSSLKIMFKVLTTYQPGGLKERQMILNHLQHPWRQV